MNVGLVAHDGKKNLMQNLCIAYQDILKKHNYWDTRPMLRDDKDQVEYGNIEGHRKVEEVNKDCEKLPD